MIGYTAILNKITNWWTTNGNNEITGAQGNEIVSNILAECVPSQNLAWGGGETVQPTVPIVDRDSINGASNALNDIVTTTVTAGVIIGVDVNERIYYYKLMAGTTATDSPNIVRPDDYNASTNAKYWQLLNEYEQEFTNSDLSSNKLTITHLLSCDMPVPVVKNNSNQLEPGLPVTYPDNATVVIDLGGTISGTWKVRLKC